MMMRAREKFPTLLGKDFTETMSPRQGVSVLENLAWLSLEYSSNLRYQSFL